MEYPHRTPGPGYHVFAPWGDSHGGPPSPGLLYYYPHPPVGGIPPGTYLSVITLHGGASPQKQDIYRLPSVSYH